MPSLSVRFGADARDAVCLAFDAAQRSIDAAFYSVGDPAVIRALNQAAARGVAVRITVEGDPHRFAKQGAREPSDRELRKRFDPRVDVIVSHLPNALVHAKAAVVDGDVSLIGTANATISGFDAPGGAVIVDRSPGDAAAVEARIDRAADAAPPCGTLRPALSQLFGSISDLRVASEDLSDPTIVHDLIDRAHGGHHDRVLVGPHPSRTGRRCIRALSHAGVEIRVPVEGYMHEKFVDAGTRLYVGSANLTFNGIDESHEIGIIAEESAFDDGGARLRGDFDRRWSTARPALRG